jgi:hypothetical protein
LQDRSEDETNASEYWDDEEADEDLDNEEDIEDEESESQDSAQEDCNQEERLENAENQKISSEKMSSGNGLVQHRARINFDDLSVVAEEEEPKKSKEKKSEASTDVVQQGLSEQTKHFAYLGSPFNKASSSCATGSFGYQRDRGFVFPHVEPSSGYSNVMPADGNCILMTSCPKMCPEASSRRPVIPLAPLAIPGHDTSQDTSHDRSHEPGSRCQAHPSRVATGPPPPPIGWQNDGGAASPATVSRYPFASRAQTKDLTLRSAECGAQLSGAAVTSRLTSTSSLAERRAGFFQRQSDIAPCLGTRKVDNACADNGSNVDNGRQKTGLQYEVGATARGEEVEVEVEEEEEEEEAGTLIEEAARLVGDAPRHFFAPLAASSRFPGLGEAELNPMDDLGMARHSDNGNSPSSEKTSSTVVSRGRYNTEKGSADICVNGAVPYNEANLIEKGDAKAFFSSENLFVAEEPMEGGSGSGPGNALSKSISCQDLSTRLSFDENLKYSNEDQNHAKSDNALDNMSLSSRAYKSQLNVTLRPCKSPSPDIPEIPKLPSIDYKLFNNPFLQNFEQAYQNFPVRTEGQSPVTHPLSIQVSESPVSGTKYSSPVRVQPSFTGPSASESDCGTCKRKNLERLRLVIPPAKLSQPKGERQEYQVTSFETPSPRTVQIPPMTPYEIESLRRMPTGASPVQPNSRLYQNVPFVPRGAALYCPGQGVRMYYDTVAMKVPAQTQTSVEEEAASAQAQSATEPKLSPGVQDDGQPTTELPKKRRSSSRKEKEKSGSVKDKRKSQGSQKRKDQATKQASVTPKDASESPGKFIGKSRASDIQDDKNESRSSSSGQESPKKEQTKRVSLYFSTKKRPSLSSVRTSRSRSVENTRERMLARDEGLEGNTTNSERERTNSISSREVGVRGKMRKASTSSGNVPWCACWGNGCI